MDNWLLIIVATIFIICIVVGYVRGFLKLGISLLSTVLTLVLVSILSPYVADALEKLYTGGRLYRSTDCRGVLCRRLRKNSFHRLI